jgi:hypothetical protein
VRMAEITQQSVRRLRWALELLLSLNLAWLTIWVERVRSKALGGRYADSLIRGLYRTLRVDVNEGPTVLDQIVWGLFLAAVCFLILRLLSHFAATRDALRRLGGALAIAAFPAATLLSPLGFLDPNRLTGAYRVGLALEVGIISICAFMYYLQKPWMSVRLMTVLIFVHFAFWAAVTEGNTDLPSYIRMAQNAPSNGHPWLSLWFSMSFHFGAPLIGFLTSVIWTRYVKSSRGPTMDTVRQN